MVKLLGGRGADILTATAVNWGRETHFDGGDGNDQINGSVNGSASPPEVNQEWFEFTGTWGKDQVTGFDVGYDRLVFNTSQTGLMDVTDLIVTGNHTMTVLHFGGQSVTLHDVPLASFDLTDVVVL